MTSTDNTPAPTRYGIMTDYDYTSTHKRERLSIWSGPFASTYEGEAFSLPKGDGYMVTTYNGDRVRVTCPAPRTDATFQQTDDAINAALNAHYASRATVTVWYQPHDDPAVGFIVNDEDDMRGNYDDLRDEGEAPGTFADYLATWESATIPEAVWLAGDDVTIHAYLTA